MGENLAETPKEKMPTKLEQYLVLRPQELQDDGAKYSINSVRLRIGWSIELDAVTLLGRGQVVEQYRIKKGGSDPVMLFGPQAGRKYGVAPALLTYLPASQFCGSDFVSVCAVESYKIEGGKPRGKP